MIYFSLITLGLGGGGPACREAGTTWSKGNKTRLGYWSRAPVIVGSNPTRPTTDPPANYPRVRGPIPPTSTEARLQTRNNNQPFQNATLPRETLRSRKPRQRKDVRIESERQHR